MFVETKTKKEKEGEKESLQICQVIMGYVTLTINNEKRNGKYDRI